MKQHLVDKAATVEPGRARRGSGPALSETQPGATRHPILQLQGTIGNQAVNRLLQSGKLQTKRTFRRPGDTPMQRQESDEEELLQGKFPSAQRNDPHEALQKQPGAPSAPLAHHPNRTGLPDHLKAGIESLSDLSMDNVNVHYNSSQPARLNALAYTQGTEIHVAPGQEQHLPHEAWHVVQQAQGRVQPTMQLKDGVPVNDDQGLEQEADVMGGRALSVPGETQRTATRQPIQRKFATLGSANSNGHVVQRRFGFEIEVPIFFTSDYGHHDGTRRDPGKKKFDYGGFEIKVDHNDELIPLVKYANEYQNGNRQGFSNGPSIIEMVTKPMDEFQLSEAEVGDRANAMAHWIQAIYGQIRRGEVVLQGDCFVGSDAPARTLQSTRGYFQATYGIKLSKVPKVFKQTAERGKQNSSDDAGVKAANQLIRAAKAGDEVVTPFKKFPLYPGMTVQKLATKKELGILKGYTVLLANYLCADTELLKGTGLAKNQLGDYFYKTDLGDLSETLPNNIKAALRGFPLALTFFTQKLAQACGRNVNDKLAVDLTVTDWVHRVVNGGTDLFLEGMKNPDSAILDSEAVGPTVSKEMGVIMENREPQKLDKGSKAKSSASKAEWKEYLKTPHTTKDELESFLSTQTDPKKYDPMEWATMMKLVYNFLRKLNG
ncbi:MAG: DUF4157 domain-containing protein [Nitrospira sp.]|nr:DUF4157 domain-containing protein [Nitrospira sp.]